jgi:hypothetical protein
VPRPQPSHCDIGAYEADVAPCAGLRAGCVPPIARGAALKIRRLANGTAKLAWKWKGAGVTPADLGIPTSSTGYALCLFDEQGGTPARALEALVPPGVCAGKPCWKTVTGGFTYRNRDRTPSGIDGFRAKVQATGAATMSLKAGGDRLPVPTLPFAHDPAVIAQLVRMDGSGCWEARFGTAQRNDGATYAARSD